jgi:hypothetical protein
MDNLLSTKFILTVMSMIFTAVLLFVGKVGPEMYEEVTLIALGIYATANVAQKFSPQVQNPATPVVPPVQ